MECVTTDALNSAIKCERSDICASAECITTNRLNVAGYSKACKSYISVECVATDTCYLARNIESSDSRSIESIVTDGLEFRREYKLFKTRSVVERITIDRGHAARKGYACKRGVAIECSFCDARCSARNGYCLKS